MTTALLIVDHGSKRAEANALLEEVATQIRRQADAPAIVRVAHMELAPPTIADAFAECVHEGATRVVVHPFMLAPGRHVSEDIPRLVAEAATQHEHVEYAICDPLGVSPGIVQLVLDAFNDTR